MPCRLPWLFAQAAFLLSLSSFHSSRVLALDLLSAGWSFVPPVPGSCPDPDLSYDCFTNRTATSITVVGSESLSGQQATTFSYFLPVNSLPQGVRFTYNFLTANGNAQAIAYYQLSNSPLSLLVGAGSVGFLRWMPGESFTFATSQNGLNTWAGQLEITNFYSVNLVPAPLPLLGAAAFFSVSRATRKRLQISRRPLPRR